MTDPQIQKLMSDLGRRGAQARIAKYGPAQRSAQARKALQTRLANGKARPKHAPSCRCRACAA